MIIGDRMYFDHSIAGIEMAAKRIASMLADTSRRFSTSIAYLDIETYTSRNVISSVGYNPSVHKDHAARYDTIATASLRQEAIRYQHNTITRIRALLKSAIPNLELGSYNLPMQLNWYRYNNMESNLSVIAKETSEILPSLFPLLSFTGPLAQLLIDRRMSDGIKNGSISYQQLIDWHATSVRLRRQAFGNQARIMPTIWPRLYAFGGASLPNGSAGLPKGFMTKFCNALLDAGAQGFVCWLPAADAKLSVSDQQAIWTSWTEVIQVARSRGFKTLST